MITKKSVLKPINTTILKFQKKKLFMVMKNNFIEFL